jgi:MFS family permease
MMRSLFRTLRYKGFRLFFIGQGISLIGTQMQLVALSWLAYRLTGSASMLGLVNFVSRSPTFVFAPLAGVITDRIDRRKAFFITQALAMLQAALLAWLVLSGRIQVWHLFVLGFGLGVINGFEVPVRQALIFDVVEDKADLGNALALNTTLINGGSLLGPLVAGPLIALIGEGPCFVANAISFIAVLACVAAMPLIVDAAPRNAQSGGRAFREGFQYVRAHAPIRSLLLILFLVSLVGFPHQVLLPVFAKEVLGGGPKLLGALSAASGAGTLLGTLYLAGRPTMNGLGRRLALAATVFGLSLVGFALARTPWLSMLFLAPAGLGSAMVITGCQTLIQGLVDDPLRGRVMSFYTMAFMGTVPFGGVLYGFLAERLGAPVTVLLGGLACAAAGLTFWGRLPRFRALARPILERKGVLTPAR